ncbi:ABC-type multidrug transport system fused ATPase/permease subunit [Dysgonomonas hofstadii]|uniref:ABC-type multidrug transport system fused ATPase/permease subunit n=1 Tax=Dysgonomonas hofstadii TaxID=637886 RepID=A0A840CG39_9BACT|nr:hypothetical protein [Dysgonomonas hofstadii]MBB4034146.1 ABC-type multidrug transport system fused ATPase/permease subunit [Dysgonomonas hofstadii]
MDIKDIISKADPNILIFLLTTFCAFLAWLSKGLVEKPLEESKETFNRFLDKRIEILTEVKVRLNFIAYFPTTEESKEFKEQLQELILKDGKVGYLNKDTLENILKISIDPKTDEKLLLATIKNIDEDLSAQISKIQDEISFFRKFSNFNPFKKFWGLSLLSAQYILSLTLITSFFYLVILGLITFSLPFKIGLIIIVILILYFLSKYINKS